MGFTEAAREGHTEEYCRSNLGLQWDMGARGRGVSMWKEQETMGELYPPCQRTGWSLDGRKLESGALPSSQEDWASPEKGMYLLSLSRCHKPEQATLPPIWMKHCPVSTRLPPQRSAKQRPQDLEQKPQPQV